jgi:hypothetical protein
MCHIILSSVACAAVQYFPHYLINWTIFGKRLLNINFFFFFTTFVWNISHSKNSTRYCHKYTDAFTHLEEVASQKDWNLRLRLWFYAHQGMCLRDTRRREKWYFLNTSNGDPGKAKPLIRFDTLQTDTSMYVIARRSYTVYYRIHEGQLEMFSGWSRVMGQKNEAHCKRNVWFEVFLRLCWWWLIFCGLWERVDG